MTAARAGEARMENPICRTLSRTISAPGRQDKRFRELIGRSGILQLPGAHNGLAALQAKAAGFEALYLSGAAMTASMGLPDLGIITVDEVCFFIRQIARATGLPMLVDGDTGYGEALNVMHMVRAFEDAGAGAVQIEDQLLPKKCGHLNDKKLADAHDMAAKIAAAAQGAPAPLHRRPHRCRGERGHGRRGGAREALCRGRRRRDLPRGAAPMPRCSATFAARMPSVPLLANMTEFGRTPFFTAAEFEAMGYKMVIWPVCVAARRRQGAGGALCGDQARRRHAEPCWTACRPAPNSIATIGYHDYEALDASIVRTIVPEGMPQTSPQPD